MANDFSRNPWVIDTAFSAKPAAITPLTSVMIDHFEFCDYTLDTDSVTVQDFTGGVLWDDNGASDLRTIRSGTVGNVRGILVPTLSSGKLLVFFKH